MLTEAILEQCCRPEQIITGEEVPKPQLTPCGSCCSYREIEHPYLLPLTQAALHQLIRYKLKENHVVKVSEVLSLILIMGMH